FFIDEFQDTSRFQWENLSPLIEETLSKAGSLFYVGDKKQAIYEFRGGESALFDEVKTAFPSVADKIEEKYPEVNYRSRENIVSFINKTFSENNLRLWIERCKLNEETTDIAMLLKTYAHSQQKPDQKEDKKGGLVKVERISPQEQLKKEEMDTEIGKHLVALIKKGILGRFSPSDIAILVRTNNEASTVTRVLTGADISVASEKTLDISSNTLIQEIVSFLSFLDSPIDNLSFACFISGDIFQKVSGLSRDRVFSFLLKNRGLEGPIRSSLYVLFRDRFPQVWKKYIEEYFNAVGFLPLYDLAFRILKKYNVFRDFPDDEGFFYQFLEVLKETGKEVVSSAKPFLDYWYSEKEKKEDFQVVLPEYTNAVKVLTIHKAKGLGFPVVIIPFAYLNNSPINEAFEKEGADSAIPYYINKGYTAVSPRLKALYKERFSTRLLNELNTFYVAVSRAKDELYIFLPNYKRATGKLHVPLFPERHILQIGTPLDYSSREAGKKAKHLYPTLRNEWHDKLHRPRIETGELIDTARKEAIERGTLIHKFLAGVERLPEAWREGINKLFARVSGKDRNIVPFMEGFFERETFRKWFTL
ncbi:UvrD-helicase domain-containing protein, partial [bacterium]|nr:UvrD-helicase domain-containing protein [bacterium]